MTAGPVGKALCAWLKGPVRLTDSVSSRLRACPLPAWAWQAGRCGVAPLLARADAATRAGELRECLCGRTASPAMGQPCVGAERGRVVRTRVAPMFADA